MKKASNNSQEDHCSGLYTTNKLLEQVGALYICHNAIANKTILRNLSDGHFEEPLE